jgi:hypothetical protein
VRDRRDNVVGSHRCRDAPTRWKRWNGQPRPLTTEPSVSPLSRHRSQPSPDFFGYWTDRRTGSRGRQIRVTVSRVTGVKERASPGWRRRINSLRGRRRRRAGRSPSAATGTEIATIRGDCAWMGDRELVPDVPTSQDLTSVGRSRSIVIGREHRRKAKARSPWPKQDRRGQREPRSLALEPYAIGDLGRSSWSTRRPTTRWGRG